MKTVPVFLLWDWGQIVFGCRCADASEHLKGSYMQLVVAQQALPGAMSCPSLPILPPRLIHPLARKDPYYAGFTILRPSMSARLSILILINSTTDKPARDKCCQLYYQPRWELLRSTMSIQSFHSLSLMPPRATGNLAATEGHIWANMMPMMQSGTKYFLSCSKLETDYQNLRQA